MTVRVSYGTTNFIAAFINISTKRRVRNKADAVSSDSDVQTYSLPSVPLKNSSASSSSTFCWNLIRFDNL